METVALRPLLEEVASTIAGVEDVSVSVQPVSLQVNADPDHLRRVFINLVENAVKYAPATALELVARPIRNHVDIDVIDHGEGIPIEQRHQVFEAFNQLERSDTRTRGGTGLGLSIVKGLVEAMGGRVMLAETPGGGSTFTVSLQPASAPLSPEPSVHR
jgi:signal transduction histidine kinase